MSLAQTSGRKQDAQTHPEKRIRTHTHAHAQARRGCCCCLLPFFPRLSASFFPLYFSSNTPGEEAGALPATRLIHAVRFCVPRTGRYPRPIHGHFKVKTLQFARMPPRAAATIAFRGRVRSLARSWSVLG